MDRRISELESIRGWAALSVLVHHCLLAFAPRLHGLVDRDMASLFGTPAFALINGGAAVTIFFVLSGYVLAHAFARGSLRSRIKLVATRWPRLAFPVVLVNVAVALLIMFGSMWNQTAAEQSGSSWLAWFYHWRSNGLAETSAALKEGAYGTFLLGSAQYNSSLWTMRYELYGSFLVFGVAAACSALPRAKWFILASTLCAVTFVHPNYGCFIVGAAMVNLRRTRRDIPAFVFASACILLIYFAGYHEALDGSMESAGWYAWLSPAAIALGPEAFRVAMHTFVAVVLIWGALNTSFGMRLVGPVGRLLGKSSFSLYLVHVPIICSLGAWAYLAAGTVVAVAVSILVSFVVAVPLTMTDKAWRKWLAVRFERTAAQQVGATPPLVRA